MTKHLTKIKIEKSATITDTKITLTVNRKHY